jgi:hypothetical protein
MTIDETRRCKLLRHAPIAWSFGVVVSLVGCAQVEAQPKNQTASSTTLGKPVGLAINGFNYTDLAIESFSVAYQGGGNIAVSSPTSGGGGTTCCVTWRPGTKLPLPIRVEWMRYVNDKQRWCKKTVMLTGPVPSNPTAIGVHFMRDGGIKVELSEGYPELKLRLNSFDDGHRKESGNVIHDEKTASCRDGY